MPQIRSDRPLRILVAHNRYKQPGGEDGVFANEMVLLRGAGHEVHALEVSNDVIGAEVGRLEAAVSATYSRRGYALAAQAIADVRPDVLHVHNFFPLLSPAIFDAAARAGVPAVLTLHNFRFACPQGTMFRDGAPCEKCLGKVPWHAVRHRCYQGSAVGSAAVATSLMVHRVSGTWKRKVARFIVLSDRARAVAVQSGVPAHKIMIKPNFAPGPEDGVAPGGDRRGALYLGRLSAEKGARVAIEAWQRLPHIELTVMGEGPERAELQRIAPANVRFLGQCARQDAMVALQRAEALILPSTCFENFSLSLCEAMAHGTPVIASAIGAQAEIIDHARNGILVPPGDPLALAQAVRQAFNSPRQLAAVGQAGYETWAANLSPSANLERLLEVYRDAIAA